MLRRLLPLAAAALPAVAAAQGPAAPAAPAKVPVRAPSRVMAKSAAPDPLPLKYAARPTTAAITPGDLMSRLYVFADDSMMGREAGTEGNVKGTAYLAAEARRLGLQPAGDSGTYFQTLPFKTRTVDSTSRLVAGGRTLAFGVDFASAGGGSLVQAALPVVYGGVVGDSAGMIPATQAAGKLVVMRVTGITPAVVRALRGSAPIVPGAAAVAITGLDVLIPRSTRPATFLDKGAETASAASGPAVLLVSTPAAAAMFGRGLDGLAVGTAASAPVNAEVRVALGPARHPARNVVAVLPGSDPTLRAEYVAIGAHNDHVGYTAAVVDHDSLRIFNRIVRPQGAEQEGKRATPAEQEQVNRELAAYRAANPGAARRDSIRNGADDDGSGSVTLLEIAERMAAARVKPKRSVLFVWHTGEEKGLLGAEYFTDRPTVAREAIVAQLNMDMVGRGAATDVTGETKAGELIRGGPGYLQLVGSRRLSTELGDLVEAVNRDKRYGLRFDYSLDANGHPQNIYCRSDHYEYARYGIPVVFFTTGGHADYHQVTDEPQYIDYQHLARVAGFVGDVAERVADLDHRVRVDQPKPDPKGECRQ